MRHRPPNKPCSCRRSFSKEGPLVVSLASLVIKQISSSWRVIASQLMGGAVMQPLGPRQIVSELPIWSQLRGDLRGIGGVLMCVLFLTTGWSTPTVSQEAPTRISDERLADIAAVTSAIDVDTIRVDGLRRRVRGDPATSLRARLYVVPTEGSCEDGGRNCGYRYYLAVAARGASAPAVAWDLGEFGPLLDIYPRVYEPDSVEFDISLAGFFPLTHSENRLTDPRGYRIAANRTSVSITLLD